MSAVADSVNAPVLATPTRRAALAAAAMLAAAPAAGAKRNKPKPLAFGSVRVIGLEVVENGAGTYRFQWTWEAWYFNADFTISGWTDTVPGETVVAPGGNAVAAITADARSYVADQIGGRDGPIDADRVHITVP